MNIFLNSLVDVLKDTAIVIPLLYLSFLLVGYFSHNESGKFSKLLHHTKKAGPCVGAFLGCIPQCGFPSVISNLYSHKVVTIGTLFAVFIATSDEAIIRMIAKPQFIPKLLLLLAIKLVYAVIIGYAIDFVVVALKKRKRNLLKTASKFNRVNFKSNSLGTTFSAQVDKNIVMCDHGCKHVHEGEQAHHHQHEDDFLTAGCTHEHIHSDCCATNIFLDALKHTAILTAYIFVASLAIKLLVEYVGLEKIMTVFPQNVYLQILIACLIGLIPNCAAAVLLVQMYMGGILAFAPLVAGLCAGAGVGLIVLFALNKKHLLKNFLIVGGLFVAAFVCGILTSFIPI